MGAVDFEQWAVPDLTLTFRGETYTVSPPSVDEAAMILASAVLAEVKFGLAEGPVPPEVQSVIDSIGTKHPALGQAVYDRMVADGVPAATIDRFAVYAMFYWARGQGFADWIAAVLWTPRETEEPKAGGTAPKGSSRPKTGRRTASGNRTPMAGTRTTGRSRKT
ncbi:hypothetical protein JNB62_05365 [Microbacterium jejuense]|uniref:DUF7426 domain-containing protein n=1 Tax=Microbacterium jejuense TaxID=1263637 RepID=A0ABS7HKX4_9MICO|nr:hypothetical protein [Microbacterium jejuense]MBW9093104.1 hypothetical protein [Microbacterium jejuense]